MVRFGRKPASSLPETTKVFHPTEHKKGVNPLRCLPYQDHFGAPRPQRTFHGTQSEKMVQISQDSGSS